MNNEEIRLRKNEAHRRWAIKKKREIEANGSTIYQTIYKPKMEANWPNFVMSKIKNAKSHAKANGRLCNLKKQQVIDLLIKQDYKCTLTDVLMVHKLKDPQSMSIDRIDNNKGYTIDNIQLVCQAINFAKNRFTMEVIQGFIKQIRNASKNI